MPYVNDERRALMKRMSIRKSRHGNFRQTYIDCLGMCFFTMGDGLPCGRVDFLEIHEQFGEDRMGTGKFQQRILLCPDHHGELHPDNAGSLFTANRRLSRLQEDMNLEMLLVGSRDAWMKKYNLTEYGERLL